MKVIIELRAKCKKGISSAICMGGHFVLCQLYILIALSDKGASLSIAVCI